MGRRAGVLELGCDPAALLEKVTIRLDAADVQVGVFEALVGDVVVAREGAREGVYTKE